MDYVFLNYSKSGLQDLAVIFGKNNLDLELENDDFKVYSFTKIKDKKFWFPTFKNPHYKFNLHFEEKFFSEFQIFKSFKKIFIISEFENQKDIIENNPDEIILQISLRGDGFHFDNDKNIKVITSVLSDGYMPDKYFFDMKLCLPYFFYQHQLSLIDYEQTKFNENNQPLDKIFVYHRKSIKHEGLRNRHYFISLLENKLTKDKIETHKIFNNDIEGIRVSYGLYHLGNYFDYTKCMFNLIFETHHVDLDGLTQNWISEKTLFGVLFSNPFFLLVNKGIINSIKEIGIQLLNDEFEGNDIEQQFINFCNFINNSSFDERKNLYQKYKNINKENRKRMLEYIHSPKYEIIDFIIS